MYMYDLFHMCDFELHINNDTLYKKIKIHYFYLFTFCGIY